MSSSAAGSITCFSTNKFTSFKWTISYIHSYPVKSAYKSEHLEYISDQTTFNTSRVQKVPQITMASNGV